MSFRASARTTEEMLAEVLERLRRLESTSAAFPSATTIDTNITTLLSGGGLTIRHNGSDVGSRPNLDFIEGDGVTIAAADDVDSDSVQVTFTANVHTHDGAGANSTVLGGQNEAGASVPAASGDQSLAAGDYAQATAQASVAIGSGVATTPGGHVLASGVGSVAIGGGNGGIQQNPQATAEGAIAIGGPSPSVSLSGPQASGIRSIAIGVNAQATNLNNVAIGTGSQGVGTDGSTSVGHGSSASNEATGIGKSAVASGDSSTAIGQSALASGNRAVAVGWNAQATAQFALALGIGSVAAHDTSAAIQGTTTKDDQIILGDATQVITHPGAVEYQVRDITDADYTLLVTDHSVMFSTGNVDRIATLPSISVAAGSSILGLVYIISKIDSGTGLVTVTADATGTPDLINGAATLVLSNQHDSVTLICRAANHWAVI
jgi:hypothetical protein